MSDIFNEVKELGIEFDSSNSDLYIPVNEQTKELVKKYFWNSEQKCLSAIVTTFHNQTSKEKELWYDLAFQYLPFWEEKQNKITRMAPTEELKKMGFK